MFFLEVLAVTQGSGPAPAQRIGGAHLCRPGACFGQGIVKPENSSSPTEANEGKEEAGTYSWYPCLLAGEPGTGFLSSGKRSLRYLC